jgi:hypothetical protein
VATRTYFVAVEGKDEDSPSAACAAVARHFSSESSSSSAAARPHAKPRAAEHGRTRGGGRRGREGGRERGRDEGWEGACGTRERTGVGALFGAESPLNGAKTPR